MPKEESLKEVTDLLELQKRIETDALGRLVSEQSKLLVLAEQYQEEADRSFAGEDNVTAAHFTTGENWAAFQLEKANRFRQRAFELQAEIEAKRKNVSALLRKTVGARDALTVLQKERELQQELTDEERRNELAQQISKRT